MIALGVTVVALVLSIVGGYLSIRTGLIELSYPFLSLSNDPVLLFLIFAGGFFFTVGMLGLIVIVILRPGPQEDVITIVLPGSVSIGFGRSAFYYAEQVTSASNAAEYAVGSSRFSNHQLFTPPDINPSIDDST